MARSKTISDDQVLDAVLELVLEGGPAVLTFARAGQAAGLSPSTLVQRYGDRDALLQATLLRAWDLLEAATASADEEEPLSPEGAINILLRLMPAATVERNATDGLLLLREDIRDPVLRARGARWGNQLALALGRRLQSDQLNADELGWQMASLWQGAHTWWAFTRATEPRIYMRRMLEDWCKAVLATDGLKTKHRHSGMPGL